MLPCTRTAYIAVLMHTDRVRPTNTRRDYLYCTAFYRRDTCLLASGGVLSSCQLQLCDGGRMHKSEKNPIETHSSVDDFGVRELSVGHKN